MWLLGLSTLLFSSHAFTGSSHVINCTGPIDLSHHYDNNTLSWVTSTPFHFTKTDTVDNPVFYITKEFETAEHCGTHMDAPYHFNKQGWTIGEIPLQNFFARGILIDARKEAEDDRDYTLSVNKLMEWENKYGPIPNHSIVMIDYGWARHYTNRSMYYGTISKDISKLSFPGLSAEAAKWLVGTKKVLGVGTDTLSVDAGHAKDFPSHRILTAANIFHLENVALDDTCLSPKGFSLVVMPMKLKEGTGAPCRITALPNFDIVSAVLTDY